MLGLGGSGAGSDRSLANEGVREDVAVNYCGVCHNDSDLQTMHRRGECGGSQ